MSKVKGACLDIGAGQECINVGTLPDSEGDERIALTEDEQSIKGDKIFQEVVVSPASKVDIYSAEDDEFVTHQQAATYADRLFDENIDTGGNYKIADSNVEYLDGYEVVGGRVRVNPPIVKTSIVGKITYVGRTSSGRVYVVVVFPRNFTLMYNDEYVEFSSPRTIKLYPPVAAPTPPAEEPQNNSSNNNGNIPNNGSQPRPPLIVYNPGAGGGHGEYEWKESYNGDENGPPPRQWKGRRPLRH